jgi:molybdate transport system substrate-binding protein
VRSRQPPAFALVAALVLSLSTTACDDGRAQRSGTLTVLAASSLTGTFTDLATQFEGEHPGVDVRLVFDSSATLARMASEHAPGDVLATADRRTMDQARAGGGLSAGLAPVEFATNVLVLAVPVTGQARVRSLADLDDPGVDYLTCVVTAPCGAAARTLLAAAGVRRQPASEEVDVKAVVTKVAAGEADAGLVYRTDVSAAHGKVVGLPIPGADASPNTYWAAVTADARDDRLATSWVHFLTGPEGRAVLRSAGFGAGSGAG